MIDLSVCGPYKAHFNGGPRDDTYTHCPVGIRWYSTGYYRVREGEDGEPVPHGSNGVWVEFDFVEAPKSAVVQ